MERIAGVRRAMGLTHAEFGRAVNVPAWQMEIAECGVLFKLDGHVSALKYYFLDVEFDDLVERISRTFELPSGWLKYGRRHAALDEGNAPEDEAVFYFPVTVSRRSLMEDIRQLKMCFESDRPAGNEKRLPECDAVGLLMMKFRVYYCWLRRCGKPEMAEALKRQLLEFCESGDMHTVENE